MLPDILMQSLIFFVSFTLPAYISSHSTTHGYVEAQRQWLFYFCSLVLLDRIFFPIFEPVFLRIFSYLPFSIYYELKFAVFVSLVIPRFGLLERCMNGIHFHFDSVKQGSITKVDNAIALVKAKSYQLQDLLQQKMRTH